MRHRQPNLHKKQNLPKLTLANSKWVIVLAVTALLLFFGFTFYMRYYFQFPSTLDDPLVPPYFKRAEDAMPFPRTLDPSQFQASEAREAYAIAEEMPDVLAQQPCYCRRPVLRSLLHCFANLEATNCEICVKEAQLVAQLHRQGRSASEIRAVVVGQYGVLSARPTR
jgi:hypothetical protein